MLLHNLKGRGGIVLGEEGECLEVKGRGASV